MQVSVIGQCRCNMSPPSAPPPAPSEAATQREPTGRGAAQEHRADHDRDDRGGEPELEAAVALAELDVRARRAARVDREAERDEADRAITAAVPASFQRGDTLPGAGTVADRPARRSRRARPAPPRRTSPSVDIAEIAPQLQHRGDAAAVEQREPDQPGELAHRAARRHGGELGQLRLERQRRRRRDRRRQSGTARRTRSRRSSRGLLGPARSTCRAACAAPRSRGGRGLHRAGRGAGDRGGLGDRATIELGQHDRLALLIGQAGQRIERGADELGIGAIFVTPFGRLAGQAGRHFGELLDLADPDHGALVLAGRVDERAMRESSRSTAADRRRGRRPGGRGGPSGTSAGADPRRGPARGSSSGDTRAAAARRARRARETPLHRRRSSAASSPFRRPCGPIGHIRQIACVVTVRIPLLCRAVLSITRPWQLDVGTKRSSRTVQVQAGPAD